jgi:hypothetical protein
MTTPRYYLTRAIPGDLVAVNRYAPMFGMSESFTVDDLVKLLRMRRGIVIDLIHSWIKEGYCREVI